MKKNEKNPAKETKGRNANSHKGSFYIQTVLSYLTVTLIPILLITVLYASRYTERYKEEVNETIDLSLEQFAVQMEFQMDNLASLVTQASISGELKDGLNAESMLDYKHAISALNFITTANPYISEILLVPKNGDYAMTSTSTLSKSSLRKGGIQIEGFTPEEVMDILDSGKRFVFPYSSMTIAPTQYHGNHCVLLTYPVLNSGHVAGNMLFILRDSTIEQMVGERLEQYEAGIAVIDNASDTVLFDTLGNCNIDIAELNPEATSIRDDEGRAYNVRSVIPAAGRHEYYALISKDYTFKNIESLKNEFIVTLLIVTALSVLAGYLINRYNYRGIRGLEDKARKLNPGSTGGSEIDNVASALELLSTQKTELEEKISRNKEAIIDDRLNHLLSGMYPDRESFNRRNAELGLRMDHESSMIAMIILENSRMPLEEAASTIKKNLAPVDSYFLIHKTTSQIILIINTAASNEEHVTDKLNESIRLMNSRGTRPIITLSNMHEGTTDLSKAYMEAINTLEYCFIYGNRQVIKASDVSERDTTDYTYPQKELEELSLSLKSKDIHRCRLAVNELFSLMEETQIPVYIVKSISYDMVTLMNNVKLAKDAEPLSISNADTLQEIKESIISWLDTMNDREKLQMEEKSISSILAYVDENCFDINFSVSECAEHFDMNISTLSKYIKDHTGNTIMDHVIDRRLERSKELLRDTDLSFKEISEKIGYSNLTSFNRRFKLNTGMPPGKYRKISRE